jgi:hypothetical protein
VKSTNGGASYGTPVKIVTTYDSYDIGIRHSTAAACSSRPAAQERATNNVYALWADLPATPAARPPNEPGSNTVDVQDARLVRAQRTAARPSA